MHRGYLRYAVYFSGLLSRLLGWNAGGTLTTIIPPTTVHRDLYYSPLKCWDILTTRPGPEKKRR